jgi:uroporphyrinogen-III synthase
MSRDERSDLEGFTIWITADRRAEDQAVMFRRLGASVLHGPTMATVVGSDDEVLRRCTAELIKAPPDYVIANTGMGVRIWVGKAEQWGVGDELRASLASARILSRGPKASGALSSTGLPMWWRAPGETLDEVVDHLVSVGVSGARIAFQLHGDDGRTFVERLEQAGAQVMTIAPYRWTLPGEGNSALDALVRCCDGRVDAVTFTAGPQVRNLMELADSEGRSLDLLAALNGSVVVGCIGPVCAAVAESEGMNDLVVPENWRLGSLVKAVGGALQARPGASRPDTITGP